MAFVDKTVAVAADVRRVYELWTVFEDYPKFMEIVEHVTVLKTTDCTGSPSWTTTRDGVGRRPCRARPRREGITWRAMDGRETGEVRFEKLAADRTQGDLPARVRPRRLAGQGRHRAPLDEEARRVGSRGLQAGRRGRRLKARSAPWPASRRPRSSTGASVSAVWSAADAEWRSLAEGPRCGTPAASRSSSR